MRRALLTLGGTAAGLAALLSFKTHTLAATTPAATPASMPAASAGTSQPATGGASQGSASPAAGAGGKNTGGKKASAGAQTAARTVTGAAEQTQYGPMQVQVMLSGKRITKVTVVQRTNDGAESTEIDNNAIPKLTSETLTAQSAQIDAVSGATYTSSGYIKSLQSALDQAGG
jgi:uncharacterized protein with FMN-binding domain